MCIHACIWRVVSSVKNSYTLAYASIYLNWTGQEVTCWPCRKTKGLCFNFIVVLMLYVCSRLVLIWAFFCVFGIPHAPMHFDTSSFWERKCGWKIRQRSGASCQVPLVNLLSRRWGMGCNSVTCSKGSMARRLDIPGGTFRSPLCLVPSRLCQPCPRWLWLRRSGSRGMEMLALTAPGMSSPLRRRWSGFRKPLSGPALRFW